MKRLLFSLPLVFSSFTFADVEPIKHPTVCLITDMYDVHSTQEPAAKHLIEKYKSACTINVRVKERSRYEEALVVQKIIADLKQIRPNVVYTPSAYITDIRKNFDLAQLSIIEYSFIDELMLKAFFELVDEFDFDFNSFVILYDDSTRDRKEYWEKRLKEKKIPVLSFRSNSKRDLMRALSKIQKPKYSYGDETRGIILNLMADVVDHEFNRRLSFEDIKEELQARNYKFLTFGVERSRRFNEGIVFDVNPMTNKVVVLVNKSQFEKLGWEHLYLDNNWTTLGGFVHE